MKKKILIIIISLLIIFFILLATTKKGGSIILKTNGGVPYNWQYTIENPKIVKFKAKKVKSKNKNLVGGEVIETYVFKGMKKGTTTITFNYKNTSTNRIEQTKKYTVTVDNNLNLKIKEKKF